MGWQNLLKLKKLIGGALQWFRKITARITRFDLHDYGREGVVINICQQSATFKVR